MTPELENLLTWAKTACEEMRAQVGWCVDDVTLVPSWLPELENAISDMELAQ